MRFLLIILLCLITVPVAFGQNSLSDKPTRTVFSIKAVDDKTNTELPAQFTIKASLAKTKFVGASQPGKSFDFVLTRTDTINVVANAPGYAEAEELMVISCDTCPDYGYAVRLSKEQINVQPPKLMVAADSVFRDLAVNRVVELDNVYFDQSSYVLRPESYPQLDKLAKTLTTTPKLVIEIAGHTDNVGDRRLNLAPSEDRSRIIRNYLATNGIADNRLRPKGSGGGRPAAPNDSEENKRKNRRVEFVVLAL